MTLIGAQIQFQHQVIDQEPPCGKLGFCLTADLTENGRKDIIVGGAGEGFPGKSLIENARTNGLPTLRRLRSLVGFAETNLFWYENPGFERHDVAVVPHLDVGAAVGDITGDGTPNVVAGQGLGETELYWFDIPDDPRQSWDSFLITDEFEKYHDIAVADIDDDDEPEVVGISQESETIFYYDTPPNPRQHRWPEYNRHIVAEDVHVEGIEIADIDGDGQTELIAGTTIYHQNGSDWNAETITTDWDLTRVAVADLDGDGELEVVFSEGDSPHLGTHPGRVAWFDPPEWEPTFLKEDLFCPHSLQVADFSGNGWPDIYVAEMGLGKNETPQQFLFLNRGNGEFEERTIATGIPTHEAKAVDLTGNGRPDIAGKSYGPDHHVDVWYNQSN